MEYFQTILEAKKRSRRNMPQIDDFQKFMQDVVTDGYKVISKSVDPDTLSPTQHDFNDDKVKAILDNKSYNSSPIIITNDDNILDGHHRWKACSLSPDQQDVIQVDMPFDTLYDYVKDKDYVKYKEIHESNFNSNYSMASMSGQTTFGIDDDSEFMKFHKKQKALKEDGEGGGTSASGGEGGAEPSIAQNDKSHPESFASGDNPDKKKNLPNSTVNVDSPENILFKMVRRKKVD